MLKIGVGYNKINKKSNNVDDYEEKVSRLDDYQENITVIDGVSYYTTQSSNPDLKVNVMVHMRPVAITHLNYRQSLLC